MLTESSMMNTIAISIDIKRMITMRTIQMTLDDDLVESVDKVVKDLRTTRSAFTRDALRDAIERRRITQLEKKHRMGYQSRPVKQDEFSVWEKEQNWGQHEKR
jgi:metal-responsive CopG/Arc/MetJ family transcriptional regulator